MIAFSIAGWDIYRYGIFYLIGFLIAYLVLYYIARSNILNMLPNIQHSLRHHLDTIMILIILGVLLGGRLGYVLIYERSYYQNHLNEIRMIRKGGMAFIGGMIGVTAVLIAYAIYQGFSQADFRALIDSMLVPVPFGIMLGRIGNFLNQEIPGLPVATDFRGLSSTIVELAQTLHIFHVYDQVDNTLRRNPNILASIGEGLIVGIILVITRYYQYRKKVYHPGKITAYFLIAYSFIRFFLEYTRVDSSQEYIGLYTISQYFFIGFLILGIGILIYTGRFKHIYSNTPQT